MSEFGTLLRQWRNTRSYSQLELSLAADVSAKHISFLETGRATPSRGMIFSLAATLDLPLCERNVLLHAAGYAESYSHMDITQPEMAPVKQALEHLLSSHEPYPAAVVDRDWNIVMCNQTHHTMLDIAAKIQPDFLQTDNAMELLLAPNGLRPFIENWDEIACLLLQRIQRQSIVYQQQASALLESVLQYPDIPKHWRQFNISTPSQPVLDMVINIAGQRLKTFSSLSTFGTAIDITTQELTIEHFFPGDEATKIFFKNLQAVP